VDDMSSTWSSLPPLILAGAGFLVLMETVGRERRRNLPTTPGEPSTAMRWAVITLLFVASMAHIPLIPEHLGEAPYMGVLFIAFSVTTFGLATMLAVRPALGWYLVVLVLCTAGICAYVATRLVAFPQLADDVGAWTEPLGIVSIAAEALAVLISTIAVEQKHAAERG
jgi:hypothetical protein